MLHTALSEVGLKVAESLEFRVAVPAACVASRHVEGRRGILVSDPSKRERVSSSTGNVAGGGI